MAQGGRYRFIAEKGNLVIGPLTPRGHQEISRANILKPDTKVGRAVAWSHPAFANRCVYARSDSELVCVSLAVSRRPGP